ncbi:MAG: HAD family phosphatase [Erysipelotrichaceae bacterium]|jgi:HAD superfamily hydrolase (TIGR01509 family)|uniref:HAD family hydrolase n=1 Tax=Lactimicrobium massiliense TaxID=2161814 RepID=UPI000D561694|nr:HAD family phosphatase [Lactimicrobium massiliense]MCH4021208.1 HAD family phosphatase [Erysipelotrichaceae bacterium]MCH4043793.1 HAD family phosphatase [Erysipelotrichaceae bacterium]MCH4121010.1 HAD family phosphatase [Erysipelotrichaceae bacterium]
MQLSVKPELVIFDVDGLMLNTEFIWKKAWEESGRLNGIDSFGSAFCKAVGITGEDVERMLAAEYPHEPWRIALAQAREIGSRKLLAEVDVMPGVMELLAVLEKLQIPKAVATTTSRIQTEERLSKLHLLTSFDCILCGDEVKYRKPNPEIYQTVLRKMNCRPEDALVLEDTGYGVRAASAAGIRVIMVPSINTPTTEDIQRSFAIVSSLLEVKKMMEIFI